MIGVLSSVPESTGWIYLALCAGIVFSGFKVINYFHKRRSVSSEDGYIARRGFSTNTKLAVSAYCILVLALSWLVHMRSEEIAQLTRAKEIGDQASKAAVDSSKSTRDLLGGHLLNASQSGELEEVKRLLNAGAEVNTKDNDGRTALMAASRYGHTEIAKVLISKGADVNARDMIGYTALTMSCVTGHTEIVKFLISNGADVNAKDDPLLGFTALMDASAFGHTDIVKVLISNGADVNARGNSGWTALMLASDKGYAEIVKILLAKGADVNAEYEDGTTALMRAYKKGHSDVAKLLRAHGAKQ